MTIAECEYCGTRQTIPNVDNEKKLTLFSRANRLRYACEFDKAASVYESIIADFPEEAEAYWGLVLCQYGIEYVDDPATGKKIPTCHRSSFSSVLDDVNFELVMEYADAVARKVYREEAKAIEELRRSIIEVSGREAPYDIFICYKETDENGQRTIDSVLAQDVYDALTEKGYRVFFSRITLEDKLGQEYEPYIFAALNSAKVMLAFGTDYEYFNAVWVKNEWSRYLQLMTQDKSRHLIPCYKGIDAYDMPREFAKLQAQDMGKVGAVQDLLRGIEKLIPRKSESIPIGTAQPVITTGGPNVEALLKRGSMALEDGTWKRASEFFDQVLNMNAECGAAYLGKALAEFQVSSLNQLEGKYAPERFEPEAEKLMAGIADRDAEERILVENIVPGYLDDIDLNPFDFSFFSTVSGWKKHQKSVNETLNQSRNLTRAEQYGDGTLRQQINAFRKNVDDRFSRKIEEAEAQDEGSKAEVQARYAEYLAQIEENAAQKRQQAEEKREIDYQAAIRDVQEAKSILFLRGALAMLKTPGLANYKESEQYIQKCEDRINAIEVAENRRKRLRKQRVIKICASITGFACAVIAAFFIGKATATAIINRRTYTEAQELLEAGEYEAAATAFESLGDYKDANTQAVEAENAAAYDEALALFETGEYGEAAVAFGRLENYSDAKEYALSSWAMVQSCCVLSAGNEHTVGLKIDGTVIAVGDNYDSQCSVTQWENIVSVAAGGSHTVGLKIDGTVITCGSNSIGQCDVSEWTDIIAVTAGGAYTVGLKTDGTVVATGINNFEQCGVSEWTDIVAVSAGRTHTVGLNSNGMVMATGYNDSGQCDVSDWTNIVAIAVGRYHTIGLKSNGTVVATGSNGYGQCDVSDWTDIQIPE
ncbi:MAG: TIR domain-containing protein [Oscillospiraceae bacterium]|nr:TIR domain-containing protein [Oscillospiraceae bacterium]